MIDAMDHCVHGRAATPPGPGTGGGRSRTTSSGRRARAWRTGGPPCLGPVPGVCSVTGAVGRGPPAPGPPSHWRGCCHWGRGWQRTTPRCALRWTTSWRVRCLLYVQNHAARSGGAVMSVLASQARTAGSCLVLLVTSSWLTWRCCCMASTPPPHTPQTFKGKCPSGCPWPGTLCTAC
jgi:hypothetical protein